MIRFFRKCRRGFFLLVFCYVATPVAATQNAGPFWLIDLEDRDLPSMVIDGTYQPILNPFQSEHAFLLSDLPPYGDLTFAMGLKESEDIGKVRFEVILERNAAQSEIVYQRDLSEPGWVEAGVSLPVTEYPEGRLIFRKTLLAGSPMLQFESAWGDPALVPQVATQPLSVVLVSIDTLRADHLGCYGYAEARTPTFDRIAAAGTLYGQAYSPSLWTYPSHAALFFGVSPSVLPVPGRQPPTADSREPLPQVFRKAGYRTAGFTGGGYLTMWWGFEFGFGTYFMFPQPRAQPGICDPRRLDGHEVFQRGTAWLRSHAHSPFFLFLHTYDVHDRCPVRPATLAGTRAWADPGPEGRLPPIHYYDRLIARTDQRLAALYDEIEKLGIADSTLVVVTSDHGEGFWEHGFFGHGCRWKPYEEVIHVPLILHSPRVVPSGQRIDAPVSLLDLAPTILSLTGIPVPPWMQGRPLPGLGLPNDQQAKPVYVECEDSLAVRSGSYKLITSRKGGFSDEIYDLADDPTERKNLLGENRAIDAELRSHAAAFWNAAGLTANESIAPGDLDEKTKQHLRALGYLE